MESPHTTYTCRYEYLEYNIHAKKRTFHQDFFNSIYYVTSK